MVDKWRLILQDLQRATLTATSSSTPLPSTSSSSSDQRGASAAEARPSKLESAVAAIRSSEEYSRFVEMHKTPPPPAVTFMFDISKHSLATAVASGRDSAPGGSVQELDPNAVILNDATADTLRARLQDNEVRLAACRSHIQDKQTMIIQYETELNTIRFKSDPASVARVFAVKSAADVLKKEVNELRCGEQKLTRQNELIQAPLSAAGNALPQGCDTSAADALTPAAAGESNHIAANSKSEVRELFNKHFFE